MSVQKRDLVLGLPLIALMVQDAGFAFTGQGVLPAEDFAITAAVMATPLAARTINQGWAWRSLGVIVVWTVLIQSISFLGGYVAALAFFPIGLSFSVTRGWRSRPFNRPFVSLDLAATLVVPLICVLLTADYLRTAVAG